MSRAIGVLIVAAIGLRCSSPAASARPSDSEQRPSSTSSRPSATPVEPPSATSDPPVDSTPCLLWMPPKLRHRAPYARVFELEDPTIEIGPVGPVHGIGDLDTAVKLHEGERVVGAIMICNAPLFLVRLGDAVRLDVTTDSGPSVRATTLFPGKGDSPLDPTDHTLHVAGICRTPTHADYALVVGKDHLIITWSEGTFRARRTTPLASGELLQCHEEPGEKLVGPK